MKFSVQETEFRPAWKAVQPVHPSGGYDEDLDFEMRESTLRIEADNGFLTFSSRYGSARIPAQIEERGVLFVPLWEFIEVLSSPWDPSTLTLTLDSNTEDISTNYGDFMFGFPWQYAEWEDPAAAPQTWVPEELTEEEKRNYLNDEEPDDAEGAARMAD